MLGDFKQSLINIGMKIHEYLLERDQRRTRIMYHGTIDKHLESIRVNGLLAAAPQKGFGSDTEGFESFGGVYLTPDIDYAIEAAETVASKKPGTQPILVKVQYVVTSGGPDEDLFFSIFIWIGVDSYAKNPWLTYQDYIATSSTKAANRLKQISTPTRPTFDYIEEFYKEFYSHVNAYLPFSAKDLAREALKISNLLPRDEYFTLNATKKLVEKINLDPLRLSRDIKINVHTQISEMFGYIKANKKPNIEILVELTGGLLAYLIQYSKIFSHGPIQKNQKLRDAILRILNSTRDAYNDDIDASDTTDVRVDRNIGYRGKNRILEITNIQTGETIYTSGWQQ